MKLYNKFLIASIAFASVNQMANAAAVVTIGIGTNGTILADAAGLALSGGPGSATAGAVNGDGAAVQIGYYQGATAGNPFGDGNETAFISLVGAGSVLGLNLTVGDTAANFADNGEIYADVLVSGRNNDGLTDVAFPAPGIPLVMRFFTGQTLSGSQSFGAVTNNLWLWTNPVNLPSFARIEMPFDAGTLRIRNGQTVGSGEALRTSAPNPLAIPEPSSLLLLSAIGLISLGRRNRK